MLTRLQHIGQLATERGLTRTLQTRHQHNGRTAFKFQFNSLSTHQFCQFVVDYLDHQLTGLDSRQHVHAQRLLLDSIRKLLGHLVVDIGIQQCLTHILQGFGNVNLGDFSLTFQYLERPFKSVT